MKILLLILTGIFYFNFSFSIELLGKSVKCETQRENIRGYPFFFFFENETNVKSFYISAEGDIRFHIIDYKEVKPNLIDIRYIGQINKSNLILKHNKGKREYTCSFLPTKENIDEELQIFK